MFPNRFEALRGANHGDPWIRRSRCPVERFGFFFWFHGASPCTKKICFFRCESNDISVQREKQKSKMKLLVGGFNPWLKNISQNGNLPQVGMKITNL